MDAKRLYHIFTEFAGLFVGSDHQSEKFIRDFFPDLSEYQVDDHIHIPHDELTAMTHKCCEALELTQSELTFQWRLALLSNLIALTAANFDTTPLLRQSRGKLDFMMFATVPTVLESNTQVYLQLAADISTKAAALSTRQTHHNPPQPQHLPSGHLEPAFSSHVEPASALAQIRVVAQRIVVVQLAKGHFSLSDTPTPLSLSPRANHYQTLLVKHAANINVDRVYTDFVLHALDMAAFWLKITGVYTTPKILWVICSVACELCDMVNGSYEGKLWQCVPYGLDRTPMVTEIADDKKDSDKAHKQLESYILPLFRQHVPAEQAELAQNLYDYGLTEEDAMQTAIELPLMDRTYKETEERNQGKNDKVEEELIRETVGGANLGVQEGGEDKGKWKEIHEMFGDQIKQVFSINVGLTRILRAEAGEVAEEMNRAFRGELIETKVGKVDKTWTYMTGNSEVWMVALSYKHRSRDVRMSPQTVDKVSRALCEICRLQGCSNMIIWIDAILSVNKNLSGGNWAVNGLYPYLTGDVVRIVGKDGDYDDCDESSMWMTVENECGDPRCRFTVTLDESKRGYSWTMKDEGHVPLRDRMMDLARGICKGALNDKLVSWRQDKIKLILWAEACMIAKQPLLMDEEELEKLSTLQIDNVPDGEMERYVSCAREKGCIRTERRNRGSLAGWLGVFELFPGLYEATRRGFRALFPLVREQETVVGEIQGDGKTLFVFASLGGVNVQVDVDAAEKTVRHLKVMAFKSEFRDMQQENETWRSMHICRTIRISAEEEEQWH